MVGLIIQLLVYQRESSIAMTVIAEFTKANKNDFHTTPFVNNG